MPLQEELLAEVEIRSLILKERYYKDSHQWEKMRQVYHPDASKTFVDISWITGDVDGFISGSIEMAAGGIQSAHSIQPVEVTINNRKALTISYGSIILRCKFDEVEYDMESWGRWVSRQAWVALPSGPEWKMVSLEFIYDRDSIIPAIPFHGPPMVIDIRPGARESYKYLEWFLVKRGYSIPDNCPGTDIRESVTKLLAKNEKWLQS